MRQTAVDSWPHCIDIYSALYLFYKSLLVWILIRRRILGFRGCETFFRRSRSVVHLLRYELSFFWSVLHRRGPRSVWGQPRDGIEDQFVSGSRDGNGNRREGRLGVRASAKLWVGSKKKMLNFLLCNFSLILFPLALVLECISDNLTCKV